MNDTQVLEIQHAFAQQKDNLQQLEQQVSQYVNEITAQHEETLVATVLHHEPPPPWVTSVIEIFYFVAAILFILGLKRMSSPVTARGGIIWAGIGMILATLATFFHPAIHINIGWISAIYVISALFLMLGLKRATRADDGGIGLIIIITSIIVAMTPTLLYPSNYGLIVIAVMIGSAMAWISAKKVAMTDMPQMIALYNGMGGGAAAAIAAVELAKGGHTMTIETLAVAGGLIGSISFSGSLIAFAKLQGILKKSFIFNFQQLINLLIFITILALGIGIVSYGAADSGPLVITFFMLTLAFGILMTLPIGGADMPVVISLYNALTGLAVAFEGFVLGNAAMIIAGTVVGAAGTLLTQLMAKAMNRSLGNVLFSGFGAKVQASNTEVTGSLKPIDSSDAAAMMAYATQVVIVPGYGMAVAQAQHKIWELTKALSDKDVKVKFAIHPVAGRMPGHMNVLLAEAGVPYDMIFDLEEINEEFPQTDVALIIGANDVVNPIARTDPSSPIYGMPILNADYAKNVIVIKRGSGAGFSGIENHLFYANNTRMLYGDGQKMAAELVHSVKAL